FGKDTASSRAIIESKNAGFKPLRVVSFSPGTFVRSLSGGNCKFGPRLPKSPCDAVPASALCVSRAQPPAWLDCMVRLRSIAVPAHGIMDPHNTRHFGSIGLRAGRAQRSHVHRFDPLAPNPAFHTGRLHSGVGHR